MASNTRNAILKGAGQSFARLGYGATRVEDIIEDAGVSRATFYKFFDGKEQVFDAIEEAFNFSFTQAMESAWDTELEPTMRADALLEAFLRWIAGWRDLGKIMWMDPTRPRAQEVLQTRDSTFLSFINIAVSIGNEEGLAEADPLLYRGVLGAIAEIGNALSSKARVREADIQKAKNCISYIITSVLVDVPQDLLKT